ncbi:hypothetical protein FRB91_010745 [Serendipita sp. 411]|nr:hypothetical protein FRB91_010745 [Serendipita sp. 411]
MSLSLINSPSPEPFPVNYDHVFDVATSQETTREIVPNFNIQYPTVDPFKLASSYSRSVDQANQIQKLDDAIANQKARLELLPVGSRQRPIGFFVLARLYEERFDKDKSNRRRSWRCSTTDLKNAIANQKAGVELLSDDSPHKPNRFFELARLYKRKADTGRGWLCVYGLGFDYTPDHDNAIANQKAGLDLLSDSDPQKPTQISQLARLYEERSSHKASPNRAHDINNVITSHEAALNLLPDGDPSKPTHLSEIVRARAILNELNGKATQSL